MEMAPLRSMPARHFGPFEPFRTVETFAPSPSPLLHMSGFREGARYEATPADIKPNAESSRGNLRSWTLICVILANDKLGKALLQPAIFHLASRVDNRDRGEPILGCQEPECKKLQIDMISGLSFSHKVEGSDVRWK